MYIIPNKKSFKLKRENYKVYKSKKFYTNFVKS